jgi:hypothetical protein
VGGRVIDQLNVYILGRADLAVKDYHKCFVYEINRDYLTNDKSAFTIDGQILASEGDFVLVKQFPDKTPIYDTTTGLKPLYVGVIDSFDNNKIVACDLYNIVNFQFPATTKTGTDFGQHINNLLNTYLTSDASKLVGRLDFEIDDSARVAYSYNPEESPTVTNFVDYLINGFKKYNITLEANGIYYNQNDGGLMIRAMINRNTDQIQIKNNTFSFVNWDVYQNKIGRNLENELLIVDKTTANSELPNILSTWYLDADGDLTQSMNDNILKPTKTKIYLYDQTQSDPPAFAEVAQSELVGNNYSHEINFEILRGNKILDIDDLKIGLLANIVYNGTIYDSVLSGYSFSSGSNFIKLKFGHTRSTLREALETR